MTLTLKPEYQGEILEIIRYETANQKFDTNEVTPDQYEYYYHLGFDWAFDVS